MNPKPVPTKILYLGLALVFLMIGCTDHQASITSSKKAILTKELIIENAKCSTYINQLLNPTIDDLTIEKIYHDATIDGCIKKDI